MEDKFLRVHDCKVDKKFLGLSEFFRVKLLTFKFKFAFFQPDNVKKTLLQTNFFTYFLNSYSYLSCLVINT